ncbi:hypothetical protein [Streptomyces sp. NPDC015131]|uniref:hypothetical protein n=1 Tax=Streptomyces sp. NPDC015131 TaxID=3364941 RepID=UPI0036F758E5
MPDDLLGRGIALVFGAAALLLFQVYLLLKSWLGAVQVTRDIVRTASGAAAGIGRAGREVTSRQRAAALTLTAVLILVQAAWLMFALAMANISLLAYTTDSQESFQDRSGDAAFRPTAWLAWTPETGAYTLLALALLLRFFFRTKEPSAYGTSWLLSVIMLWWVAIAFSTLLDLLAGFFGLLGGVPGGTEHLANGLLLTALAPLYFASSYAALRSARHLGNLWIRPARPTAHARSA